MNLSSSLGVTLAAALVFSSLAVAEDMTPPVVRTALPNITVSAGTAASVIALDDTFALEGVTGPCVRFTTTVGAVDVELFDDAAPKTVAAFLKYAHGPSSNATGSSYSNTLIQRAVPDFIVQGGGYFVDAGKNVNQILNRPAVPSEAGISNTRGTLAWALTNGPGTGTGDWFFNVVANSSLDGTANGGPFTVFGQVIVSMATLDAIEALRKLDLSPQLGPAFSQVPVVHYVPSKPPTVQNLISTKKITEIPLLPVGKGAAALLKLKVRNSNPRLLTAKLSGSDLKLTYRAKKKGTATIDVSATDAAGTKVNAEFTVTVQ